MCSRYTYDKDGAKIRLRDKIEVFGAVRRSNIRPTDLAPIILPESDGFACHLMNWGWIVPWDKSPLFNAKSETLTTLKTFRPHLQNRCLLLADGFYEKGVLFIQQRRPVFCLAGLWREEGDGKRFTMLTTTPNETVAPFHHRMPFILRPEQHSDWLGEAWEGVLSNPARSALEKLQEQPDLL